MLNVQLILFLQFCRVITFPYLPITMSLVFRYPGAFHNPKATSSTLSIQVLPGRSLKVQSNVMFPCFFPITRWLGPETILGRCCWCDAGQLKISKRQLNNDQLSSKLHVIEKINSPHPLPPSPPHPPPPPRPITQTSQTRLNCQFTFGITNPQNNQSTQ